MKKIISACAALALLTVIATPAGAAEPAITDEASAAASAAPSTKLEPMSLALLAGHGFKDAFGTGFGARVGYTVPNKIYLGGSLVYHVGQTQGPVQANVWYGGGEVGYDVAAGPFIIRPYAGVGAASINATVTVAAVGDFAGGKVTASQSRFAVWPGAMFLFPFEQGSAFIGVDAKVVVVDNASALNTYGTFGLAF
ncbi:MAG: outer membrane beta-barrel protein [Deltaproteobacteria bacterium]|nr:outer membrane beta-barrel protein [Deltaproteobacteria bacterium]